MLGPLVKSVLKETVEKLPEDFAMKAESVPNYLIKQGVKPEELKFAELGLPEGKVTKADLKKAEELRGGTIGREPSYDKQYDYVTLRGEEDNPTYTEQVYWFNPTEAVDKRISVEADQLVADRVSGKLSQEEFSPRIDKLNEEFDNLPEGYTSGHFVKQPNYLMHARTIDQDVNGTPTRTILELQSDLHQQGRQHGYRAEGRKALTEEELNEITNAVLDDDQVKAVDLATKAGWPGDIDIAEWLVGAANAPSDAPFKSNWLRKLMEFEVARAQEDGLTQVAIPISGKATASLYRGEGVQKWYETTVKQTAEKLAKATGGTVEYVTKPGTSRKSKLLQQDIVSLTKQAEQRIRNIKIGIDSGRYPKEAAEAEIERVQEELASDISQLKSLDPEAADMLVIKPGPKGFTLYAGGGASALAVANAMQEGYNDEEIRSFLKEKGLADDEIEAAMTKGAKAQQAIAEGYTPEEVQGFIDSKEPKIEPSTARKPAMDSWQGANAAKIAEGYKQAYGQGTAPGPKDTLEAYGVGEKANAARRNDAYQKLTSQEAITAQDLVTSLQVLNPALVSLTDRVRGFTGDRLKQAQVVRAEEASRQKIIASAKERGIELAFENGEYYAKLDNGQYKPVTPDLWDELLSAKGEAAGGIAGAIAGARAGAMLPVPHPLVKFLGSAAGAAIGAAAGSQADYLYNAIKLSEDMNAQVAANKALTAAELSVIGDVVAYPIAKFGAAGVRQLIRAKRYIAEGNPEGAYAALKDTLFVSDTEAQQLVDKLSKVSSVPGVRQEEQRIAATALTKPGAQSLVHAAISADPKASQAMVQAIDARAQDLLATTKAGSSADTAKILREDLDNYIDDVKQYYGSVKSQVADGKPISFNYDALAVEPVLKRLEKNIQDPATLERFLDKARAIRETSDSRTFADLLELRHQVNDFLYNKRIASAKDREAIREVVGRIDSTIESAARTALPNGDEWLKSWASAKAKYAQMIRTRENVLTKALQNPQLTEAEVGNRLVKHMQTVDGTLEEVLNKLPPNARKRAEWSVLNTLANKFTAGTEGGLKATNFPMLAKELDKMVFTTPDARTFKKAVQQLAEVFTNDTALARASGNVNFTKPQGFLADDIVSKFKYQAAQTVFQEVQKYMPTAKGRGLALVSKVAEILENPLHAKTIKELMADLSPEVSEQVKQLQQATARAQAAGKDAGAARVNLYGTGNVLSAKGTGAPHQIPLHRIATTEQVRSVADAEGIALSDTKALDKALKSRGFAAVMQGSEKARKL